MKSIMLFCTLLLIKAINPEMFNEFSIALIVITIGILVAVDVVGFIIEQGNR